jgi:uncharacterized phiE125 gp8 family phage protein
MATAPVPPPPLVPVAQAKDYLRIAGSEEDALLAGFVRTASELCEAFTRLLLIERDIVETVPARPAWTRLSLAPVRAIESVAALAPAGPAAPLGAADYAIDIDATGEGWVRVLRGGGQKRVEVRYRAGLASDWNGVPEALRQGVLRMAAHLYARREAVDGGPPPAAVTALWLPYRRLRLR